MAVLFTEKRMNFLNQANRKAGSNMAREIKFRGKRVDNREWVYGYYTVEDGSKFESHYGSSRYHIITESSLVEVIPETVGQFTGLKDMSGIDSYEGDILKDNHGYLYVMRWSDQWGGFCLAKPSGRFADGKPFYSSIYYSSHNPIYMGLGVYDIIGNIHDNYGLLASREIEKEGE